MNIRSPPERQAQGPLKRMYRGAHFSLDHFPGHYTIRPKKVVLNSAPKTKSRGRDLCKTEKKLKITRGRDEKFFVFVLPLDERKSLCCAWQKIVIMHDNNILTFLAADALSRLAIGAEVSDLMILMVGRKKVFFIFDSLFLAQNLRSLCPEKNRQKSFLVHDILSNSRRAQLSAIFGSRKEAEKGFRVDKMPAFIENTKVKRVSEVNRVEFSDFLTFCALTDFPNCRSLHSRCHRRHFGVSLPQELPNFH